ncbi:MAG: polysaccharide deacetylase family protein [Bacteroidales bacterium]|nr:polysaccharide deacetylase family protein [Bacteroidales bacterium]
MNVLIVSTEFGYDGGGLALSCSQLKDILASEHHVLLSLSSDYPIKTVGGGYNPSLELRICKEYKLKQDTIAYKNTDVVIGFGGGYNGYYASLLAERLKSRFILSFRGSDINITKWSPEDSWYNVEACRRADKIVCLSKEMTENVLSLMPASLGKLLIIPIEISCNYIEIKFPNLPNRIVLGCAASHLNEKKGIGNLLYMISECKSMTDIPVSLELVGDIDDDLKQNYCEIIKNLGIENNVIFHGYKTRIELNEIMTMWDFYIQASVCEGGPNVVAESLNRGCAFISSKTGYMTELLCNDFPCLFFDSFEPKAMAVKLLSLINHPNLRDLYRQVQIVLDKTRDKQHVIEKWHDLISTNVTTLKAFDIENVLAIGLHDVDGEIHDSITTPTLVFQQFVEFIHENGYGLCSMKEYIAKPKEERNDFIVCTFDDGYKSLVSKVKPIFDKYGFTATVFVCTSLIGKDNKWNNKDALLRQHLDEKEIIELHNFGWEIASHGVSHSNLLKLSDSELDYELSESKRVLSKMVGEVTSYAYPYGAFNDYIKSCVEKHYDYAFAVSTGGTSLAFDALQLRRYSISDIYKMLL